MKTCYYAKIHTYATCKKQRKLIRQKKIHQFFSLIEKQICFYYDDEKIFFKKKYLHTLKINRKKNKLQAPPPLPPSPPPQ